MTPQLQLLFPPPLTAKQLAACAELDRIVTEARNDFRTQLYAKNRMAQKRSRADA